MVGVLHRRAEVLCPDVDVDEHRLGLASDLGVPVGGTHRDELVWTHDERRDRVRFAGIPGACGCFQQRRVIGPEIRKEVFDALAPERPEKPIRRRVPSIARRQILTAATGRAGVVCHYLSDALGPD